MKKNSRENFETEAEYDNVIAFPAVGTYHYNAQRLHRYAGSLMKAEMWGEFDIVMGASALYDQDLIDVDWDPRTGEPIFIAKKNVISIIDSGAED